MIATADSRVTKTPDLMGGRACIGRTRIAVWTLIEWMRLGVSDDRLLADYPDLTAEDLLAAREYYNDHRAEIDSDILNNNRD